MTEAALRLRTLTRLFGRRLAVKSIDLDVPAGSIFGFLGPNGSGKITTIRMILGLLKPDQGTIEANGINALAERSRAAAQIGSLFEAGSFYPNISSGGGYPRQPRAVPRPRPSPSRSAMCSENCLTFC